MSDWAAGVEVRRSSHNGGSMVGGPPRWVWHTYEADPTHLTALQGARGLIAAGNEVHFTFNPISGQVVQILPASVAGRGLRNAAGGVQTNRMGTVCLQVEVIAYAAHPWTGYLTSAGRVGLHQLVTFARSHGIPDVWPAGPPPAYPPGSGNRSPAIWRSRAGHYGHSQVPENTHGDPGALDLGVLFASSITALEDDMTPEQLLAVEVPIGPGTTAALAAVGSPGVTKMTLGTVLQITLGRAIMASRPVDVAALAEALAPTLTKYTPEDLKAALAEVLPAVHLDVQS